MTIIPVTMPTTWNVPATDGVPSLLGDMADGVEAMASVTAGTMLDDYQISSAASLWGIFDTTGTQVLTAAHVRSVELESEHRISDAPQEDGGFVSYNKVKVPLRFMVEMLCDGSETGTGGLDSLLAQYSPTTAWGSLTGSSARSVRTSFLTTLEAMEAATTIYAVHTPEMSYPSANVIGHRYRRETHNGLTLLTVQIMLQEVRTAGAATVTNTATASGQQMTQLGTVSTTDATSSQQSDINDALLQTAAQQSLV